MEAMEDDEAGGFKHSAKVPRLFKVCASIITLHEGENTCNYFNQNLDLANLDFLYMFDFWKTSTNGLL